MLRVLMIVAAAVMLAVAASTAAATSAHEVILDQAQTGRATSFQIPASGVWQSFTPAVSGNLTSVHILLGTSSPLEHCLEFDGVLSIHRGEGVLSQPYFTRSSKLLRQAYAITECRCSEQDCLIWQEIDLVHPVAVLAEETYSFFLTPPMAPKLSANVFRVGLAVADLYPRGINNFAAPGYDYTFKTYVKTLAATDGNAQVTLAPVDTEGAGDGAHSDDDASSEEGFAINSTPVLAVAGSIVGIIAIVAVVLLARRRSRQDRRVLASSTAASFPAPTKAAKTLPTTTPLSVLHVHTTSDALLSSMQQSMQASTRNRKTAFGGPLADDANHSHSHDDKHNLFVIDGISAEMEEEASYPLYHARFSSVRDHRTGTEEATANGNSSSSSREEVLFLSDVTGEERDSAES